MFSSCGDDQSLGVLPAIVLVFWIVSVIKRRRNVVRRIESARDAFLIHSLRLCCLISKSFMEFLTGFPIINEQPLIRKKKKRKHAKPTGNLQFTIPERNVTQSDPPFDSLSIMYVKTWRRCNALLGDAKLGKDEWPDTRCHRAHVFLFLSS